VTDAIMRLTWYFRVDAITSGQIGDYFVSQRVRHTEASGDGVGERLPQVLVEEQPEALTRVMVETMTSRAVSIHRRS
jgi:hypothetical protein